MEKEIDESDAKLQAEAQAVTNAKQDKRIVELAEALESVKAVAS
jgi:hypothetical protein